MILARPVPGRSRLFSGSQEGMTLVEMLVVLAIIGLTAGASVLALGSGAGLDGQSEARRLQARLQLAADAAMISDAPLALSLKPGGYGILDWNPRANAWQPRVEGVLGEVHTLPRGMTVTSRDGRALLPIDADDRGDDIALVLQAGSKSWIVAFDGLTARVQQPATAQ